MVVLAELIAGGDLISPGEQTRAEGNAILPTRLTGIQINAGSAMERATTPMGPPFIAPIAGILVSFSMISSSSGTARAALSSIATKVFTISMRMSGLVLLYIGLAFG